VDRLPVFKALGDNTRYAIYLEVARSSAPLSTADIAETLDLHPNTVRPHLERMREIGLLEVETERLGLVGRPQHRYSLAADAPSLGLEPSAFRLLARLACGVAAEAGLDDEQVADLGRGHGRELAQTMRRAKLPRIELTVAEQNRSTGSGPAPTCVALLGALMGDLGFDPATAEGGATVSLAFTRCPFHEVAQTYPDVVCQLHRGIVEGIVDEAGGARVAHFATLSDRNPCQVDLVGA